MALDPLAEFAQGLRKSTNCDVHPPLRQSQDPEEAQLWSETVERCSPAARRDHLRWLGRNDLFFLLVYLLNRRHFIRDGRTERWTFDRCREVQADPNGYVDLWPRESFKSEIITFGLLIQDLLNDPEKTFGIFSHTRPLAGRFLTLIKREFEQNELLKSLYDDVLWADPKSNCLEHSVPWTQYAITLKRKGNRKEATIESWGLTDGQPTGRRFTDIIYDDVVSQDQISPLMMDQTTAALRNSLLLTASDPPRYRYIATFQEIGDTTQQIIDQGIFKCRKRGPLDANGQVAFCSDEKFALMRNSLDTKIFALNILLDPAKSKAESDIGFKDEWLEYYDEAPRRRMLNVYGLVDPAGDTPDSNSQFALWVVGLGADRRLRILDILLDKYDLEECWQAIFTMQQKWECLKWGYEKFGMQRDIEHYKYRMREVNYLFNIQPLGGVRRSKDQRIAELVPWFKDHRIILPHRMLKHRKDGREVDLVKHFLDVEYRLWPYNPKCRDMLDSLARITDAELGVTWPKGYGKPWTEDAGYGAGAAMGEGNGSYMSE